MSIDVQRHIGDVIVLRGVRQERIDFALPMFVVLNTPEQVALYYPAGTKAKSLRNSLGERPTVQDLARHYTSREPEQDRLRLVDTTWIRTDVLMLVKPGMAHAIYLMRDAGWGNLIRWYVNLQDPLRRTPIGYDTWDHLLDIEIRPDRTGWRWKDEEDLAEAVAAGLLTIDEALAARKEGEKVIRILEQNQPPFCDGWENWSPPKTWGIPLLPENWSLGYS